MIEGFWTVQFTGVEGWGAGVITLMDGQIFGGDSGFLYTGTYNQQGSGFNAHVHVKQYAETGRGNVMGYVARFDLVLRGGQQGKTVTLTGNIPGTALHLSATLLKQADLPERT